MQLNKMYRIFHDIKFEIKRFGQQMMAFSKKSLGFQIPKNKRVEYVKDPDSLSFK